MEPSLGPGPCPAMSLHHSGGLVAVDAFVVVPAVVRDADSVDSHRRRRRRRADRRHRQVVDTADAR